MRNRVKYLIFSLGEETEPVELSADDYFEVVRMAGANGFGLTDQRELTAGAARELRAALLAALRTPNEPPRSAALFTSAKPWALTEADLLPLLNKLARRTGIRIRTVRQNDT